MYKVPRKGYKKHANPFFILSCNLIAFHDKCQCA